MTNDRDLVLIAFVNVYKKIDLRRKRFRKTTRPMVAGLTPSFSSLSDVNFSRRPVPI